MRKINYPCDSSARKKFHERFFSALSSANEAGIDLFLLKAPAFRRSKLTLKRLVVLPLEELLVVQKSLAPFVKNLNREEKVGTGTNEKTVVRNDFLELFDYKACQPGISSFFANEQGLNLKMCYYCGIDHINGFRDFGDYRGPFDFLNNADYDDLVFVDGIGEGTAKKIIKYRSNYTIKDFTDVGLNRPLQDRLKLFNFRNSHDHFTLDHVLPQKDFKFLSLCLYNLVPSCYGCNSKFKKEKSFGAKKLILKVSPTSPQYSMREDFNFRIEFSGDIKEITETKDFVLKLVSNNNYREFQLYDKIFKLTGRYVAHKDEILTLLRERIKNPDCEIYKKAKLLKISPKELKELIYGKDLFKKDALLPMHKFKRDIAINLKIIKP